MPATQPSDASSSQAEPSGGSMLDFARLEAAEAADDPFHFLTVPGFVRPEALDAVRAAFPAVDVAGSVPIESGARDDPFMRLLAELEGPEMRRLVAEKFHIDLAGKPTMVTVRGHVRERDGRIHTDSVDKLVTMLIYLNADWPHDGGRLRMLRGPDDIEDYATQIEPVGGNMVAFRRSDLSYHGHLPASGERRAIQLNWVVNGWVKRRELLRHRWSSLFRWGRKRRPV